MRFDRRAFGAAVLCAIAFGPVQAAGSNAVAYVSPTQSNNSAYLVTWQGQTRARVVSNLGARDGAVAGTAAQRVVTLDAPLSTEYYADYVECDGWQPLLRQDTLQIAVNTLSGTPTRGNSSVVELGTLTTLDGCNAGHVEPFGSLTDPGVPTRTVAMNARPPVSDLVPGVSIAGPSETLRTDPFQFLTADVLLLQAGGLGLFQGSGHVVPAAFDAEQWLQLPASQRAYTRVIVDRRTGGEVWIEADWSNGQPTAVRTTPFVKPDPIASFGTVRQASRQWLSGVSTDLSTFSIYLYQTGAGERVSVDLVTGIETRQPIASWVFSGKNIQQTRVTGAMTRVRTWVPLLNGGGRTKFVMESEDIINPDGSRTPFIPPRVNGYQDTGAATPPALGTQSGRALEPNVRHQTAVRRVGEF